MIRIIKVESRALLVHALGITHPAMDASPSRENPQNVLEAKVLSEAGVQDLLPSRKLKSGFARSDTCPAFAHYPARIWVLAEKLHLHCYGH